MQLSFQRQRLPPPPPLLLRLRFFVLVCRLLKTKPISSTVCGIRKELCCRKFTAGEYV